MMMKLKLMVISKKPSIAKQRACGVRSQDEVGGQGNLLSPHKPTSLQAPRTRILGVDLAGSFSVGMIRK